MAYREPISLSTDGAPCKAIGRAIALLICDLQASKDIAASWPQSNRDRERPLSVWMLRRVMKERPAKMADLVAKGLRMDIAPLVEPETL